jgi:hypothetical protein
MDHQVALEIGRDLVAVAFDFRSGNEPLPVKFVAVSEIELLYRSDRGCEVGEDFRVQDDPEIVRSARWSVADLMRVEPAAVNLSDLEGDRLIASLAQVALEPSEFAGEQIPARERHAFMQTASAHRAREWTARSEGSWPTMRPLRQSHPLTGERLAMRDGSVWRGFGMARVRYGEGSV